MTTRLQLQQNPTPAVQCSGVLPFSIDDATSTIYVLLARSSCFDASIHPTGAWGDLGGHTKPEDHDDPAACAAREFSEESMCVMNLRGQGTAINARLCRRRAHSALQDGDYAFLLDMNYGTHRNVMYVVGVQFDPAIPRKFKSVREKLLQVELGATRGELPAIIRSHPALACDPTCAVNDDYLEKDALRWFSLDFLAELLAQRNASLGPVRLRRAFVPMIQLVVNKLNVLRT